MKKVLVLGGVSFDSIIYLNHLPEPKPKTIYSKGSHETIGSTGAGKSLSLSKLGFDVTLHGMIGEDAYGEKIKERFIEDKIQFIYEIDSKGTERHVNLMDQEGNRISIFTNTSTFNPTFNYESMRETIESNDIIVLNIINYCRHFIQFIKQANKLIWCDLHDYDGKNTYHQDFIDCADFVFMSSDCLPNYQDFMRSLIKQNKKLVICTHGKDGVSALTAEGEWFEVPIVDSYKRIDTNGAGDNFFAGFLYGYSKNEPILKCLQLGTITAGLCITSNELVHPDLAEELLLKEYLKHYK